MKLAYSIAEAVQATGLSRSSLYRLMDEDQIKSIRLGSRRLIAAAELSAFVQRLQKAA